MLKTTDIETIPTWFLPSFFGDIRLEAESDTTTRLTQVKLTVSETVAIGKLSDISLKKKWRDTGIALGDTPMILRAPIDKVAKALNKLLKPGRTIISAVKFSDGTMEEVHSTEASSTPSGESGTSVKPKATKPKAAVSVAAPVRGCPEPDFSSAELRAQEVLRAFLTPEQIADFGRWNKFISRGATSGNRYMITSRHARDQLATYHRTLFDLDREKPICTHDWDVPASEEMLALHVLLQLPGWEEYLTEATEDNLEDALRSHLGDREGVLQFDDDFTRRVFDEPDLGEGVRVSAGVGRMLRGGREIV